MKRHTQNCEDAFHAELEYDFFVCNKKRRKNERLSARRCCRLFNSTILQSWRSLNFLIKPYLGCWRRWECSWYSASRAENIHEILCCKKKHSWIKTVTRAIHNFPLNFNFEMSWASSAVRTVFFYSIPTWILPSSAYGRGLLQRARNVNDDERHSYTSMWFPSFDTTTMVRVWIEITNIYEIAWRLQQSRAARNKHSEFFF